MSFAVSGPSSVFDRANSLLYIVRHRHRHRRLRRHSLNRTLAGIAAPALDPDRLINAGPLVRPSSVFDRANSLLYGT